MKQRFRAQQKGFNLVEVMIAMAILATVVLSISTLFFFGQANVHSGKQMTKAVAIGNQVMEDLSSMTVANLNAFFVIPTTGASTVTINNISHPDSIRRSTDTGTFFVEAAAPGNFLTRWKALFTKSGMTNPDGSDLATAVNVDNFSTPRIDLVITPTTMSTAGNLTTANIVKVRVFVSWDEGGGRNATQVRRRFLVLDTTKMQRLN